MDSAILFNVRNIESSNVKIVLTTVMYDTVLKSSRVMWVPVRHSSNLRKSGAFRRYHTFRRAVSKAGLVGGTIDAGRPVELNSIPSTIAPLRLETSFRGDGDV